MKFLKWCGIAFAVLVVLAAIGRMGDPDGEAGNDAEIASALVEEDAVQAEAAAEGVNDPGISKAEFEEIQTGMTYADVIEIVGSDGELISENELAGTRTIMVQWDGESGFGANANAIFQDNRLMQKSQFGL